MTIRNIEEFAWHCVWFFLFVLIKYNINAEFLIEFDISIFLQVYYAIGINIFEWVIKYVSMVIYDLDKFISRK